MSTVGTLNGPREFKISLRMVNYWPWPPSSQLVPFNLEKVCFDTQTFSFFLILLILLLPTFFVLIPFFEPTLNFIDHMNHGKGSPGLTLHIPFLFVSLIRIKSQVTLSLSGSQLKLNSILLILLANNSFY